MSYSPAATLERDREPVTSRESDAPDLRILRPGRNCWRVEKASRAAILIDAEAYFGRLDQALKAARRSILIVGWDFDAIIRLRPQDGDDAERLGPLLRRLVEERPELEIRVLVWNLSVLHAPGASLPHLLGEDWEDHPRISVRLDANHPRSARSIRRSSPSTAASLSSAASTSPSIDGTYPTIRRSTNCAGSRTGAPTDPSTTCRCWWTARRRARSAELAAERMAARHRRRGSGGRRGKRSLAGRPRAGFHRCAGRHRPHPPALARRCAASARLHELTRDALSAARDVDLHRGAVLHRLQARRADREAAARAGGTGGRRGRATRTMHGFIEGVFMNGNRKRLVRRLKRADRYGRLRRLASGRAGRRRRMRGAHPRQARSSSTIASCASARPT